MTTNRMDGQEIISTPKETEAAHVTGGNLFWKVKAFIFLLNRINSKYIASDLRKHL